MNIAERIGVGEHLFKVSKKIRNRSGAVLLAAALSASAGQGVANAMPYPESGDNSSNSISENSYIDSSAFMRVKTNYSFNVNLNYDTSFISAQETVNVVNNSSGTISELNFSVLPKATGEFNLGNVTVNGMAEPTNWSNNSNLVVDLPSNLTSGQSATVEIDFTEHPTSNVSTFLGSSLSERSGIMQVSSWFPILSDGHAMRMPGDSQVSESADYHMELKLNRPMAVAAPGNVSAPDSTSRVVDLSNARNFSFAVSPNFTEQKGYVDGIEVDVFSKNISSGKKALHIAENALKTFDSRFIHYPYNRFVVAQGTRSVSGNEFPGIVFVGSKWLGNTEVVTHETSHQWFYGMLGNDQMQEPWLDEAFAQWAGTGFKAHSYCSSKAVDSSIYAFPNKFDYATTSQCGSYDQTVYYKGASFIEGVRQRMGDANFFASLRNLFQDHKFGLITTATVANNWLSYAPAGEKDSLNNYMKQFIIW